MAWLSGKFFNEKGRDFWYQNYRPKRLEQNITTRVISPNTPEMNSYASDGPTSKKRNANR